jgi:hypothetical protein
MIDTRGWDSPNSNKVPLLSQKDSRVQVELLVFIYLLWDRELLVYTYFEFTKICYVSTNFER